MKITQHLEMLVHFKNNFDLLRILMNGGGIIYISRWISRPELQ